MEKKSTKEYLRAIGRRKTSTATVKLVKSTKNSYTINGQDLAIYFPTPALKKIVSSVFETVNLTNKYDVIANVKGGGIHSQAEAVRHGIARCLASDDIEMRLPLKKAKMLKRDPRQKERRKFGLKKARKAPQWSKR
jgi:small subunit ribosomal protein S9